MSLFALIGLTIIISSYVTGNNPQNETYLEVNNSHTRELPSSFTTVDFFQTPFPEETEVDNQQPSSGIPQNHNDRVRSTTVDASSESMLFSHLSKLTGKLRKNKNNHDGYEDTFEREVPELIQPLSRREIPAQSEDISDGRYYLYYPHDVRYLQTDYLDYPSSEGEHADRKNGSLSPYRVVQEPDSYHEPQYYQKNYYYNYYPMVNRRSMPPAKWKSDERSYEEGTNKRRRVANSRRFNQNSCKQYLEFLKYAFEKLEEHPDYSYDYVEEEEWRDKLGQGDQHVFTTQMTGPTLYVDNSGNIAQMNSKENSIQSYDIYSAVPNAPHNPSSDLRSSTPFKMPSSSSHQSSTGYPSSTPPFSTPENDNFMHHYDLTTEHWGKSSVKIVSNSPTAKTNYIPETVTPIYITDPKLEEQHPNEKSEEDYKFNYHEPKATTPGVPTTYGFSSEGYYNTIGSTDHTPIISYIVNNSSYGIGIPYNWVVPITSQPPTRIPIPYSTEISERNNFDDTTTKKMDSDCDDKMLPCPDTVNITYPLNGYCNRYVSCESGRATRRTCPEGLHFNIITKSCDLPHNSFCTYICPKPDGYFGIPGDCGGYFFCKNSIPEYRMCPPHMHWNIKKQSCSFLEYSSCPMKCTSTNEVKPYEGDCKAYVICLSGIAYYHKCPPNTKFDKTTLTCVSGSSSKCEDDPRLLTKTVNPNTVCRDIELKVGTKTWCSFFVANQQRTYNP